MIQRNDSPIVNDYLNVLSSNGYISYINKPTRVTDTSATTLDHVFVRVRKDIIKATSIEASIIQTDMTDHFSPIIFVSLERESEKNLATGIGPTRVNFEKLKSLLTNED